MVELFIISIRFNVSNNRIVSILFVLDLTNFLSIIQYNKTRKHVHEKRKQYNTPIYPIHAY